MMKQTKDLVQFKIFGKLVHRLTATYLAFPAFLQKDNLFLLFGRMQAIFVYWT